MAGEHGHTEPPPATSAEIYAVTAEEAMEFINSRESAGAESCPICRTNRWGSIMPSDDRSIDLPIGNKSGGLTGSAVLCMALICENCGYVRLHAMDMIVRWKRKKSDAS